VVVRSVSGTILLRNFNNGTWTIVVKNVGTTAAQRVYVAVSDAKHLANYQLSIGAIDYHSMALLSTPGGFTCSVDNYPGSPTTTAQTPYESYLVALNR
jgi:hypothetical protein